MKFAAKSLVRESKKSEKESKKSKAKCKKAMEQGQMEVAKVYAQNAIRQKNESINLLQLSSRLDAVATRLQTANKMNMVTKGMKNIVVSMDKVLNTMNVEEITSVMDKFEKQFEDLDVRSEYMANAMTSTTAVTTPEDEVDTMMQQVADENQIEFQSDLDVVKLKKKEQHEEVEDEKEDELAARLKKLSGI